MSPLLMTFTLWPLLVAVARAEELLDETSAGGADPTVGAELTIITLRADAEDPVASSTLDADTLREEGAGQELAYALRGTPGVIVWSDSGNGRGYTTMSLRGLHQTRVSFTLDGMPLNDPEDSGVYPSNLADLGGALDAVQVQRGAGASSLGAPSLGGAVHLISASPSAERGGSLRLGGASYQSGEGSLVVETGEIGPGLRARAQLSGRTTEGYRDGAFMDQGAGYLVAEAPGRRGDWRLLVFTGQMRSGLAFYPAHEDDLALNPRHNDLLPSDTDRFGQTIGQVRWLGAPLDGGEGERSVTIYSNRVAGSFVLSDPAGDLRFGLDGRALGVITTTRRPLGAWELRSGLSVSHFQRVHRLDIDAAMQYTNQGVKLETAGWMRLDRPLGDRWRVFGDVQARAASFRYEGDVEVSPVSWVFVNPHLGARLALAPNVSVWAGAGRTSREPTRNDMLGGADNLTEAVDLSAVRPESVLDVELGLDARWERGGAELTVYHMDFKDEIAPTGEISELGLLLRQNVPDSRRSGVELGLHQRVGPLGLRVSGAFARASIAEWTQTVPLVDTTGAELGQTSVTVTDTPALLSPALLGSAELTYSRQEGRRLGLTWQGMSPSQLDNLGAAGLTTPTYSRLDAWGAWETRPDERGVCFGLDARAQNLLDATLWPSGTTSVVARQTQSGEERLRGERFYLPEAGRSVWVSLRMEW
ncbi:TonB-dependent receptor [Myxococcota bacterium]|nr:TonB-dependent receptor [Myxococcota bacterium]